MSVHVFPILKPPPTSFPTPHGEPVAKTSPQSSVQAQTCHCSSPGTVPEKQDRHMCMQGHSETHCSRLGSTDRHSWCSCVCGDTPCPHKNHAPVHKHLNTSHSQSAYKYIHKHTFTQNYRCKSQRVLMWTHRLELIPTQTCVPTDPCVY